MRRDPSHMFSFLFILSTHCQLITHTHYICELRGGKTLYIHSVMQLKGHHNCISMTLVFIWEPLHPITRGRVSLSSWNMASGGPSTDRPLKGHRPVNVNNSLSHVRLNRLPTNILYLPLSRWPHLLLQLPPTYTHPCTTLYVSLYPLSLVTVSVSFISCRLQYLIAICNSCAVLAQ